MAFIVVTHVGPDHESSLSTILHACTSMPFVVAQDGLYLSEMLGGLDRLWRVNFSRWRLGEKKTEFLKLPFDVVISRAFSDLATFAATSARHLAPGGVLAAMKGVHPDEELAALPAALVVVAKPALTVPGLDAARHLILMQQRNVGAGA
jgi:hypothetical protein